MSMCLRLSPEPRARLFRVQRVGERFPGPRPAHTLQLGLVDDDDEWVLASAVLACSNQPLPVLSPRCCWEHLRASC